MQRWSWIPLMILSAGIVFAMLRIPIRAARPAAEPRPVSSGDREIAWLHNPTSFESWDNFVWGVKRAEMPEGAVPSGLLVDDSAAFPTRTTSVPEIAIHKPGREGRLVIRWYKVTDEASQEAWVKALAARNPPPIAVVGGWSSDRAKELADAMREAAWQPARPLLFLMTATADKVDPEDDNPSGNQGPGLISLYDRTFRFCFTNRQMAYAVTDFVLSDPTLRPGPIFGSEMPPAFAAAAGSAPAMMAALIADNRAEPPLPGFAVEWKDDPYSTDLSLKFREEFQVQRLLSSWRMPRLIMELNPVPFSTGRMNRPNPVEAAVAEHILASLPPPGKRTVLVAPSVTAPTRRLLRSLVQGDPAVGHRLVAVTGDGLGVNTLFRDRDFAWPVRSLPVPLVMFTHADPFAWDAPGASPPAGYELEPPAPGAVRSSTEDIQLFTRFAQVAAAGAFPHDAAIAPSADVLASNLRSLAPPFFDAAGNRLSGRGEHVVVLRPVFPGEAPLNHPHADARLEVYAHPQNGYGWRLLHTELLGHDPAVRPE